MMAILFYNNRKNKVYIPTSEYGKLRRKYHESIGLSFSDRLTLMTTLASNKERKKDKNGFLNYFLHVISEDERASLMSFQLFDSDAKEEVYELLWAFCQIHPEYSLKVFNQKMGTMYSPTYVDANLSVTFGERFYLTLSNKKGQIISGYEINVPRIKAIIGSIESFTISFEGLHTLAFKEVLHKNRTLFVTILSC